MVVFLLPTSTFSAFLLFRSLNYFLFIWNKFYLLGLWTIDLVVLEFPGSQTSNLCFLYSLTSLVISSDYVVSDPLSMLMTSTFTPPAQIASFSPQFIICLPRIFTWSKIEFLILPRDACLTLVFPSEFPASS